MKTIYGYNTKDWIQAKEEMRDILIQVARGRRMIPYSDLAAKIKA